MKSFTRDELRAVRYLLDVELSRLERFGSYDSNIYLSNGATVNIEDLYAKVTEEIKEKRYAEGA